MNKHLRGIYEHLYDRFGRLDWLSVSYHHYVDRQTGETMDYVRLNFDELADLQMLAPAIIQYAGQYGYMVREDGWFLDIEEA